MLEILYRMIGYILLERLHQHEIFARGDRHMGLAQRTEEREEHRAIKPDRARAAMVFDLFRNRIRRAGEPAHSHPHVRSASALVRTEACATEFSDYAFEGHRNDDRASIREMDRHAPRGAFFDARYAVGVDRGPVTASF